jgi:predicted O-methyltransferase YrrM
MDKPQQFTASQESLWTQSDLYHNSFLIKTDDALEATVNNSKDSGIEYEIAVSAAQGKLLYLLAKSINAKRVLEVGTLGG